MNFKNPAPFVLGMAGTFMGRHYRVAGRVVMGVEEDGQTYYWNEFNLVGDDGQSATLVYEETESGPQWRMFTLFEPATPISVAEAAGKRVGDTINLDGRLLRVTLIEESHVYHIEGQAPEGVEVGDVARYFNAELSDSMVVVSWTGDEIEFYHGLTLPHGAVASAFGLAKETAGFSLGKSGTAKPTGTALPQILRKLVFPVLVLSVVGAVFLFHRPPGGQSSRMARLVLPIAPLGLGVEGTLQGATWRVRGHALTEIDQVGHHYQWHEYHLVDTAGHEALLVFGARPGSKDWSLFTSFQPSEPLTPVQAGAKRVGDRLSLDGSLATITELFLFTLRQTEQDDLPDMASGTIFYGFTAQSRTGPFLARWKENNVTFYKSQTMSTKDVEQGFRTRTAR